MKKIIIFIALAILAFLLFKVFFKSNPGVTDDQAQLILFHGDGCPHCKIVNDYIQTNKADDKVKISYHEVYYNKTNQNLLTETVKKCPEIDTTNGIGVPLAFVKAENKCLYGDTPIIDWIKTQMVK